MLRSVAMIAIALGGALVEFRNVRIKVLDHAHPDPHQ
jgi:hypothetical protein